MKSHSVPKLFLFLCSLTILAIFAFFAFTKIWGEELLVKDWYRQSFILSEEMSISQFGQANQVEDSLLKVAFGLDSGDTLDRRLKDLNLTPREIFSRVNTILAHQAKDQNILMVWFGKVIQRVLSNFGLVTKDIQRSGQPGPAFLWLHYQLFPFKSVINLAWEPEKSRDQVTEKRFCDKRKIDYYTFSWEAGGPTTWKEVDRAIEIIDGCKKPVWIHCKGGKDRTGGLVALWKKKKGYPMDLILRDFEAYRIPASPWVRQLFESTPSDAGN